MRQTNGMWQGGPGKIQGRGAGKLDQLKHMSLGRWAAPRGPGVGMGGQRRVTPWGDSFHSRPDGACSYPTHSLCTPPWLSHLGPHRCLLLTHAPCSPLPRSTPESPVRQMTMDFLLILAPNEVFDEGHVPG